MLIDRDPGDIVSFAQLQALMQRHRNKVRGVSRDAEFLRWLMDREWNRREPGRGYRDLGDRCRYRIDERLGGAVERYSRGDRLEWV